MVRGIFITTRFLLVFGSLFTKPADNEWVEIDFKNEKATIPLWLGDIETGNYPELKKDLETEILIIGGGIAGMTTAYFLSKTGKRVVLVDADRIGRGVTGHTTAKITSLHHLAYKDIKEKVGIDSAKSYAKASQEAIGLIGQIVKKEKLNCEFKKADMHVYSYDGRSLGKIKEEFEVCRDMGLPATYIEKSELPFPIKGAIKFDNQAHFHPYKYVLGLANTISKKVDIRERTRIVDMEEGDPGTVITDKGFRIKANEVVVASHYPVFDQKGKYYARLIPDRDYAMAIKSPTELDGMFIDTSGDYFSIRPYGKLLIVGGITHRTGTVSDTKECYRKLLNQAEKRLGVETVEYKWSTQDNFTADNLPYIGRITKDNRHVYVATGFNGWGMSNGTTAGKLIADMISRGASPYIETFDPSRFSLKAEGKKLLEFNTGTAKRYIQGAVTTGEIISNIKKGQGGIVEKDGQKYLVYRNESGKVFALHHHCTHMGCVLSWNSAEKSWDCPCHGSRFSYEGKVIHGPALKNLKKAEI